jgi:hypothetical protein
MNAQTFIAVTICQPSGQDGKLMQMPTTCVTSDLAEP